MDTPTFSNLGPELGKLLNIKDNLLFDPSRSVYTNRDLNLQQISLIGFDMDYTLAVYHKLAMEELQFNLTLQYMVEHADYPEEIKLMRYDPHLIIRGLVLDKASGRLLKMDASNRPVRAILGRQQLFKKELETIYQGKKIKVGTPLYASLDTLFAIPEACIYCNLVEYFQSRFRAGNSIYPLEKSEDLKDTVQADFNTIKLFDDVRHAIDTIHSDGSLKSIIASRIENYIENSPDLSLTLHKLRSTGKKLFLATNSHLEYTEQIMGYLLNQKLPQYDTWRSYFDVIIVDSKKPQFFFGNNPFLPEGEPSVPATQLERNKIYTQGNIRDFERMMQATGEQILYIGDHIYGDIVSSKKETLIRTCLVIEELAREVWLSNEYAFEIKQLSALQTQRLELDTRIGYHRALLAHVDAAMSKQSKSSHLYQKLSPYAEQIRKEIDAGKKYLQKLDEAIDQDFETLEKRFHPIWGRLCREKGEQSRFGKQISSYACIYTSHLTNLLHYSPMHFFKSPSEQMSHDQVLSHFSPYKST